MAQLSSNIYNAEKDAAEVAEWLKNMAEDRKAARKQLNEAAALLKELVEEQHITSDRMHVKASRLLRSMMED